MKVAFVGDFVNFGVGGINAQVNRLCAALRKRGVDVSLNSSVRKADVIHSHTPLHRAFLASFLDVPKIATFHYIPEIFSYYAKSPLVKKAIESVSWGYYRRLYRRYDSKVALTEYSKQLLQSRGIDVDHVISNGIDLQVFKSSRSKENAFRREFGIEGDYILSVGAVRPSKSTETVVDVARMMPDVQFVHVGVPNRFAPRKYIDDVYSNRPENLRFLGRISLESVVGAYSGAKALLHPSRIEMECLVILEAWACKTPIVVRDVPCYRGVLSHGSNSLLSNSTSDFAKNLKRILDDRKVAGRMSGNGFEEAKKRDFRRTVDRHIELYEDLLA